MRSGLCPRLEPGAEATPNHVVLPTPGRQRLPGCASGSGVADHLRSAMFHPLSQVPRVGVLAEYTLIYGPEPPTFFVREVGGPDDVVWWEPIPAFHDELPVHESWFFSPQVWRSRVYQIAVRGVLSESGEFGQDGFFYRQMHVEHYGVPFPLPSA